MPILTMYDLVLTPKGYRYPFTLRPGSPVWTLTDDGWVTVPFSYSLRDEPVVPEDWHDIRIDQTWLRHWTCPEDGKEHVIPNGTTGHWTRVHQSDLIQTERRGRRAHAHTVSRDRASLVTVPYFDLVDGLPSGNNHLPPKQAKKQLASNLDNPLPKPPTAERRDVDQGDQWPHSWPSAPPRAGIIRMCESLDRLAPARHLQLINVDHQVVHNGLIIG